MTSMLVMRNDDGKLDGFSEDDRKKWAMFRRVLHDMQPGELCKVSHWFDRSRPFHNLHMRLVRDVFEAQEVFEDFDILRKWLYVGGGFVDWIPGEGGQLVPIPKSFSFEETDDAEARIAHEKVVRFLRSERARRTLFPHVTEAQAYEAIEMILAGYERQP